MPTTYWFSHDYNARTDFKIKNLLVKHKAEGYGIYWMLIEDLYNNGNKLPKDYEVLSYDLRCPPETIKSIVENFGLFVCEDDFFYSASIANRLASKGQKSDSAAKSAQEKWKPNDVVALESQNKLNRSERLSAAREKGRHTKQQWGEMLAFFESECVRCGTSGECVKDHITPIYQGGSDGIDNLQPLCKSCNSSKGPDNTDERHGWCLRKNKKMPAVWKRTPANACETPAIIGDNIRLDKGKNKREGTGADAPHTPTPDSSYTVEQKTAFTNFQTWMKEHSPSLFKMDQPFTIKQFFTIREKHSTEVVRKILLAMENRKELLKKNKSAYLTFINWVSNEWNKTEPVKTENPVSKIDSKAQQAAQTFSLNTSPVKPANDGSEQAK